MKKQLLRLCFLVVIAGVLSACAKSVSGAPEYSAGQCQRIGLSDPATGKPIVGAEDMVVDRARHRIIFSAYDRRAVEKAAKRNRAAPPSGGIYAIGIEDLFNETSAEVASLVDPATVNGGLRPHGIDVDPRSGDIVFINRSYEKQGRKWRLAPRLMRLTNSGLEDQRSVQCTANDVALDGDATFMSFDHAKCGFDAIIEDAFALPKGGFLRIGGETYANKVRFANGVSAVGNDVLLAATLENAIRLYSSRSGTLLHERSIMLPGGPDNLSIDDDGEIIAAVHPSLFRLALNRKLGWGKAPSRIVAVATETGVIRLLFDDKTGKLFSAATVAVKTEKGLVLGSVTDSGLLVCKKEAEQAE